MAVSNLHFSISIFHFSFLSRVCTKDDHLPGWRTSRGWQCRTADEYIRCLRFRIEDRQSIRSEVRPWQSDKLLPVKEVSADGSSAVRLCHPRDLPNTLILPLRGSAIRRGSPGALSLLNFRVSLVKVSGVNCRNGRAGASHN